MALPPGTASTPLLATPINGSGSATESLGESRRSSSGRGSVAKLNCSLVASLASLLKLAASTRTSVSVALILALLAVSILEQVAVYYVGLLPSRFYSVLSSHNHDAFVALLWRSLVLTIIVALLNSLAALLASLIALGTRSALSGMLQSQYLASRAYYGLSRPALPRLDGVELVGIDNPDQRLVQDVDDLTTTLTQAVPPFLLAPFIIAFYTYVTYESMGWEGPLYIYGYFLVATIINKFLLSPIVAFIFAQERLEGNYRYGHARVRTYAESIAFLSGADAESAGLAVSLRRLVSNARAIIWREFPLDLSTRFFAGLGGILSYLIVSIPIFHGRYEHKSPGETAEIISKTSFYAIYLIYSFTQLLELSKQLTLAAGLTARLATLRTALDDASAPEPDAGILIDADSDMLDLDCVTVCTPTGRVLLQDVSVSVPRGGLLIRGPSGCGKSSLLRAIAGLWPFAGTITRPSEHLAFVPQVPYLGGSRSSFAAALAYPAPVPSSPTRDDALELRKVLADVGLADLPRQLGVGLFTPLDLHATLSVGEQQRLAFARLLYARPRCAVLDEATSALDEQTEASLYNLLHVHGIRFVSVGHRSTLAPFHAAVLDIVPAASTLSSPPRAAAPPLPSPAAIAPTPLLHSPSLDLDNLDDRDDLE
ncbi:uncharacterized protein AMSG_11639 [Thecamonas trahens ATCC 50062]|uniref:ATP-binding cassette sub-family D member 4 n=1 Tax=Thecamonas trahens ATCC 50062 TaxID=461836 RepID=A0A0L0DIU2_THETB|nr:hypothetical protein AMSG_11639 [Thecamonas trahens ATCC 50062]KNC52309.1 hypothetical protein AMSG_11639 [Thecamonas trahens ATCC 50062]|eukprot:XP_013762335.1 hypothetical protein AMSG_11639 [Thecamonas trahens ATCC 50062]